MSDDGDKLLQNTDLDEEIKDLFPGLRRQVVEVSKDPTHGHLRASYKNVLFLTLCTCLNPMSD